MSLNNSKSHIKSSNILLLLGILFIAINLRPALASLGPLVDDIKSATGLSNSLLGLLTTLPLLAFGVVSALAPLFTKRFGIGRTLFGALSLLTFGILIRSIDSLITLYLGTLMLGTAIAFGNVLLPGITKRNFSSNSGLITSLYSSTMAIGASLAAGLSIPLAYKFNLGWQGSLRVWAILSFIALLIWSPQLWRLKKVISTRNYFEAMKNVARSNLAWKIALFMGLQSFTFYVVLAWLPTILLSKGYDAQYAGWMLSLSQATGIFGSLLIPFFAGKRNDQSIIVISLVAVELVGLLGLLIPNMAPVYIWVSLIGFVLGGTFGLALLFIVIRSKDTESATELSGMAQSIGYIVAATGPILIGSLYDIFETWNYPIIILITLSFVKLLMGLGAAKEGKV